MNKFLARIYATIVENRLLALVISLAVFGIIAYLPVTSHTISNQNADKNEAVLGDEQTPSSYPSDQLSLDVTDPFFNDDNSETDQTKLVIDSEKNNQSEIVNSDSVQSSPPDLAAPPDNPANFAPPPPDNYTIIDDLVAEDERTDATLPVELDESFFWEDSYYNYQDEDIDIDLGQKDGPENEVAVVLPVEDLTNDYSIFTKISHWLDNITNQDVKKIKFALIDSVDQASLAGYQPIAHDTDLDDSVWNNIKNFFVRIYQNDPSQIELLQTGGQDIIINHSVLDNVNVKYQILPNRGIKEEIVIVNNQHLADAFIFELTLDNGVTYQQNTNYAIDAPADTWYFTDRHGRYLAHFLPLVAHDLAGEGTNDIKLNLVSTGNNQHIIQLLINTDWLFSPDRVFPITIDPSIVHDSQTEFDTAVSLNRVTTTSTPSIQLSGPPYQNYGVYTSDVLNLGSADPLLDSLTWTENAVETGHGETDLTTAGLVARWNFNETSGITASDASGNGLNGTLVNMVTSGQDVGYISGWTNIQKRWGAGALMCDNSNDYVDLSNPSAIKDLNVGTVSAWVKTSTSGVVMATGHATNSSQVPYFMLTNWGFYTHNGTTLTQLQNNSALDGQWHYLTWTSDATTLKFYIDGAPQNLTVIAGSNNGVWFNDFATNTMSLCLLDRLTDYGPLGGVIDSVSVYNRVLSDQEILTNSQVANIEFQTRTGTDTNPDDGGWEEWRPSGNGSELQLCSMDNDETNWNWDNTTKSNISYDADDTDLKIEGNSSLEIKSGIHKSDANTLALWHLDESSGSGSFIKDSSTNNYHLTPTGTLPGSGISRLGRSFDGASDVINRSVITTQTTNLTVEGWYYWRDSSAIAYLLYNGTTASNGYGLRISNGSSSAGNEIGLMLGGVTYDALNSTTTMPTNQWTHVALTRDSSTWRLYVNGVLKHTATTNPNTPSGNTLLGSSFDGIIDEVKFSNIARSAEEIYESYRLGRDHLINKSITTTDLSSTGKMSFYIASEKPGQKLDFTIGESVFANYLPDANTVRLWHLEETVGSGAYLKDSSGNDNLTPTGTTDSSSGYLGHSRYFDGSSDYLNTTYNPGFIDNISISAWVKTSGTNNYSGLITSRGTSWINGLTMATNNIVCMYVNQNQAVCTSSINDNQWHYVVGTYDKQYIRIYLDGQLASTPIAYTSSMDVRDVFKIGLDDYDAVNRNFTGYIDEIRLDNIARTPEEIRQAYEIGQRTHQVTFDFGANLDSGNLITGSGDYSFTVDATAKGLSTKGQGLYIGDKIIISENYDGAEYIAQGTVETVNATTGAVTVTAWDASSTFPSGEYSQSADAFKWQREYFDLTGIMDSHIDAVTQITLRPKNSSSASTFWLDDINSISNYLTNPAGSEILSSDNQYLQYRAILTTNNSNVTPSISHVTINFNDSPDPAFTSAITSQSSLNNNNKTAFNLQCVGVNVYSSGTTECQGSWNNTNWNTIDSVAGSQNNVTIQGTPDVSAWTGYPADGNQTIYLRLYVDSTGYDTKTLNITKDTAEPIFASINSVAGDTSSPYVDDTDNGSTAVVFTSSADSATCKWDTVDTNYDSLANTCSSTSSCDLNISGSGHHTVYLRCQDNNSNKSTTSYQLDYSISWSGYARLIEFDQPTPATDYQVRVDLNTTNFNFSHAQSAGEDIRFTDVANNPLPYWIQEWTANTSAKIWVKVPVSGTKYIKIHFGNPTAISAASGDAVFEFFDDFDDASLDGVKWNTYIDDNGPDPTITESGGNAVVYVPYRNGSSAFLSSDQAFANNMILEGRASINYGNTNVKGEFGFDTERPRPDYHSQLSFFDNDGGNGNIYVNMRNLTSPVGQTSRTYDTAVTGGTNVWHNYQIIREGNAVRWYLDENLIYDYPVNNNYVQQYYPVPQGSLNIAFGNYVWSDNTAETQYLDWVFVRQHGAADLVATIDEENIINSPDISSPAVTSVSAVEGDTTNTWTDTGDNDTTTITMNTPADTAYCKWDTIDTDYDNMDGVCESTSSCTVDSPTENTYNFYLRCLDFAGNKSASSYHIEVIVDYFWQYNREITLNSATTMTNQQVRLDFTAANFNYNNIKSDGSDVRFTDNSNNFLDYWIETWNDGGDSKVWVEIPAIGTDTIEILYGNSWHIDRSHGDNTFVFFDGFEGDSIDTNKWYYDPGDIYNSYQGSAEVNNGLLDIYIPQVPYLNTDVVSKTAFSYNTALEAKASIDFGGDRTEGGLGYGTRRTIGIHGIDETIDFWDGSGSDTNIYTQSYTAAQGQRSATGSPDSADVNVWHNYKIGRTQNNPTYYRDDILLATYDYSSAPQGNIPIAIDNDSPSNAGIYPDSAEHLYVDWVFIRNYDGTDPVFQTLGDEQSGQTVFPRVNNVSSVTNDTAAPFVDVSDDGSTLVYFTTLDNPTNVKWDIVDTDYDSLANDCSSITQCLLDLSGEGVKTVYFRATDAAGNKSTSSYQLQYTIQTTELTNLLSSSQPDENDLTLTVTIKPYFANTITDGSLKLILADEFDFSGLTRADVSASGGDVTWPDDEIIYASGTQIAQSNIPFINIAYAQGENSITFNFTGDISSEDGEITFTIGGINQPGNPPTEGPYSYIVEWYETNNATGSPLFIQDGQVYLNQGINVTASVPTSLTFIIDAVASGQSVNGATTNIDTASDQIDFGTLSGAADLIGAHDVTISTNATSGFIVTLQSSGDFTSGANNLNDFTGTNSVPTIWLSPPGSGTESYWGYTTDDPSLSQVVVDRFISNKWASFTSAPAEIFSHGQPTDGITTGEGTTRVGYQLEITNHQPAGYYTTNLIYICTATY